MSADRHEPTGDRGAVAAQARDLLLGSVWIAPATENVQRGSSTFRAR